MNHSLYGVAHTQILKGKHTCRRTCMSLTRCAAWLKQAESWELTLVNAFWQGLNAITQTHMHSESWWDWTDTPVAAFQMTFGYKANIFFSLSVQQQRANLSLYCKRESAHGCIKGTGKKKVQIVFCTIKLDSLASVKLTAWEAMN